MVNITLEQEETNSLLLDLLQASKAAERLISAMFELGTLSGEPFLGIWTHLHRAIDRAQPVVGPIQGHEGRQNDLSNTA